MRQKPTYSKRDKRVFNWLLTGCILIILMVVIGGITRLTQSGLSMVKWEPIMGTLPPLSVDAWNEAFDQYKQSPEFRHFNSDFTLAQFKGIYFWEYLHRLIGRIIGLVFLFPCLVFWIKGYFNSKLKKQVLLIFAWGAFQGVLGWVMVKSGLADNPHVSHYKLAAHLVTAIGLMAYIFWVAASIKYTVENAIKNQQKKLKRYFSFFILLIFIQLIYGALVAGLKAGLWYNTFPKMGANWLPGEFSTVYKQNGLMVFLESPGIVQFMHRIFAYLIVIAVVFIWIKTKKMQLNRAQLKIKNALIGFTILQFLLGVFTLLFAVPVILGVLHQSGAILLLLSAVLFLFTTRASDSNLTKES